MPSICHSAVGSSTKNGFLQGWGEDTCHLPALSTTHPLPPPHLLSHPTVDILRDITWGEVHWGRTDNITPKSSIVLEPIARTVLEREKAQLAAAGSSPSLLLWSCPPMISRPLPCLCTNRAAALQVTLMLCYVKISLQVAKENNRKCWAAELAGCPFADNILSLLKIKIKKYIYLDVSSCWCAVRNPHMSSTIIVLISHYIVMQTYCFLSTARPLEACTSCDTGRLRLQRLFFLPANLCRFQSVHGIKHAINTPY